MSPAHARTCALRQGRSARALGGARRARGGPARARPRRRRAHAGAARTCADLLRPGAPLRRRLAHALAQRRGGLAPRRGARGSGRGSGRRQRRRALRRARGSPPLRRADLPAPQDLARPRRPPARLQRGAPPAPGPGDGRALRRTGRPGCAPRARSPSAAPSRWRISATASPSSPSRPARPRRAGCGGRPSAAHASATAPPCRRARGHSSSTSCG